MRKSVAASLAFVFLVCLVGTPKVIAQNADSLKQVFYKATTKREKCLAVLAACSAVSMGDLNNKDSFEVWLNKAELLIPKAIDDSMRIELDVFWGFLHQDRGNEDEQALQCYSKGVHTAIALHHWQRAADFLRDEVKFMVWKRDPVTIATCKEGIEVAQRINDIQSIAFFNEIIAKYYFNNHQFGAGYQYMEVSIRLNDSMKYHSRLARNYATMTIFIAQQKKYKEALRYALYADSIYESINNIYERMENAVTLAITYKNLGMYDKSVATYNRWISDTNTDDYVKSYLFSGKGTTLKRMKQYAASKACFSNAININKKYNERELECGIYIQLAELYLETGSYDSALFYGRKAETLIKGREFEQDGYEGNRELLFTMADIYMGMGDHANSMLYHQKEHAFTDSIIAHLVYDNQAEAETRFKLTEKNAELRKLIDEKELQRIRVQKQQLISSVLAIGLVLGVGIIAAGVVVYRRIREKNRVLEHQKQVLSEQKETIDKQVKELAAAAATKSRFLANISHELRTPATLITGMIELIKNDRVQGQQQDKERLELAFNNGLKLQRMIEEILDLSRLDNQMQSIVLQSQEIASLLRRYVFTFESLFRKEEILLEYNSTIPAGTFIKMEENLMEKIINNLVINSIKFNKKGGTVRVEAGLDQDGRSVVISVTDTGIGIDGQDLEKIFERFYQGSSPVATKAKGAGLGLALVKEFTLLMSGTIDVMSELGAGTTFTLTFPVTEKVPQTEVQQEAAFHNTLDWGAFPERQTLLLIDDSADIRYYVRELFGDTINIIEAENGRDALSKLGELPVDIILTDYMMPEMDGKELVTELKNSQLYSSIPVVMLTALADTENSMDMMRLGVDEYIVKPFKAPELITRIYNLLVNNAERRKFLAVPAEAAEPEVDNAAADELRAKIRAVVLDKISKVDLSIAEVAETLGMSERQLFRHAKSLTGCTPAQLVKEIRLLKAYDLLVTGQVQKLDDLTHRVGYEHLSYFSKQFFERFGRRPTEFMKG